MARKNCIKVVVIFFFYFVLLPNAVLFLLSSDSSVKDRENLNNREAHSDSTPVKISVYLYYKKRSMLV